MDRDRGDEQKRGHAGEPLIHGEDSKQKVRRQQRGGGKDKHGPPQRRRQANPSRLEADDEQDDRKHDRRLIDGLEEEAAGRQQREHLEPGRDVFRAGVEIAARLREPQHERDGKLPERQSPLDEQVALWLPQALPRLPRLVTNDQQSVDGKCKQMNKE